MTPQVKTVYNVTTTRGREFWVLATSPGRAISKTERKKSLLDRGEKVKSSELVGEIDIK